MSTPTGRGLPEKIGHYKIVSELGRGGMGVVYKGFEESLHRYVAIKVLGDHLACDEQFLSRFTREARAAGGLSHPNVIPIYYIGDDDGLHYFAMEFVSGRSVQSMIRTEGRIGNPRAAQIIIQAANGLAAAHDAGIIHRDIKPANLMVDERGVVKVADFGVALPSEAQTKLTATGALMGTPGYLSPEHCMGESIDLRADIYALGVTYYEMLTGRMPFNAESPLALLRQILQEDPPDVTQLNSEVDADAKRILMKMIARNRDERYQTCHEVIADLEEYLAAHGVRNVTASLASRSTAAPGAAAIPTMIIGAGATGALEDAAKTVVPPTQAGAQTAAANAAKGGGATLPVAAEVAANPASEGAGSPPSPTQVTSPGNTPFVQPTTQPTPYVPPPPPQKSGRSTFAVVAFVALIAFVAAVAAAGLIGYRLWHGHSFLGFGGTKEASLLPVVSKPVADPTTQTQPPTNTAAELSNPVPSALDTAQPAPTSTIASGGQASPPVVAPIHTQTPIRANGGQAPTPVRTLARTGEAPVRTAARTGEAPILQSQSPPPAARNNGVAIEVNGEAALRGAIEDVLSSEVSTAGLQVVNSGRAGTLITVRIEPTGERELHYMGRSDTAYSSRITVIATDAASGHQISRASGNIEYTQLNASKKAEEVVGPLAQKVVEAIQNH
jgi:serine/threonine-protein kinase